MRAGKLDKTITIERFTSTVDDYGTPVETWATVATVRAQLIQSTTEEFMKGWGEQSQAAVIFRIRHLAGIDPADRITYAGRAYDLKEVKELGRREGIDLRCVAAGE
jgi:SPP1 family predicted phage head-tail adaptor